LQHKDTFLNILIIESVSVWSFTVFIFANNYSSM